MSTIFLSRANIDIAGGELATVHEVTIKVMNGAKLNKMHGVVGISFGVLEAPITFKCYVGTKGPERDFVGKCQAKTIEVFVFKAPDGTAYSVEGTVSEVSITSQTEDATGYDISIIGTPA